LERYDITLLHSIDSLLSNNPPVSSILLFYNDTTIWNIWHLANVHCPYCRHCSIYPCISLSLTYYCHLWNYLSPFINLCLAYIIWFLHYYLGAFSTLWYVIPTDSELPSHINIFSHFDSASYVKLVEQLSFII